MKNKKNAIIGVIVGVGVIMVAVGVAVGINKNNVGNGDIENVQTTTENIEITTEGTTVQAEPEEYIIGLSDTEIDDNLKAEIVNLNAQLVNYFAKYKSQKSFITEYGFLYDDTVKNTVTPRELEAAGYITNPSQNLLDYTDILYIRASDAAKYAPNIDANDKKLQLFTAYNSKDGYYLSNDMYSEGAMLDKSQYEQLVLSYSFIHGDKKSPEKNSAEYNQIIDALNLKCRFDVKYLVADNKYACVVVGDVDSTTEFYQFVLAKDDSGSWTVMLDNLQTSTNVRQQVNMELPDMELGLLPKYQIMDYNNGQVRNGFTKYADSLVQLGEITENDKPATYDCGVGRFVYMEFGDKKFIGCVSDEGKLEFYSVNNVMEAMAYMNEYDQNPPTFILKYSDGE